MDQASDSTADNTGARLRRHSLRWRDDKYRLDSSTRHFWGGARLILLPCEPATFRMTPDDALFVRFGAAAGCDTGDDPAAAIPACQAYLEQNGYRVWTIPQALELVRDDTDPDLAEQLMDRLIYFFFVIQY